MVREIIQLYAYDSWEDQCLIERICLVLELRADNKDRSQQQGEIIKKQDTIILIHNSLTKKKKKKKKNIFFLFFLTYIHSHLPKKESFYFLISIFATDL